jgi:hypothetical protein
MTNAEIIAFSLGVSLSEGLPDTEKKKSRTRQAFEDKKQTTPHQTAVVKQHAEEDVTSCNLAA